MEDEKVKGENKVSSRIQIDQEELLRLYTEEYKSLKYLGNKYDCCKELIRKRLHKLGIKVRTEEEQYMIEYLRSKGLDINKDYSEIIEGEPICCDLQGSRCIYRMNPKAYPGLKGGCDYLSIEGHMRGCSPDFCTKYTPKKRRKQNEK